MGNSSNRVNPIFKNKGNIPSSIRTDGSVRSKVVNFGLRLNFEHSLSGVSSATSRQPLGDLSATSRRPLGDLSATSR